MDILQLIKSNSEIFPKRLAWVCENEIMTYKELEHFSNKLARYITKLLGNDKTPIVVYGHKNPYMLVCFMACVKSGHAYCPLDISFPIDRIQSVINQVNPPIIFLTEPLSLLGDNIIDKDNIIDVIRDNIQASPLHPVEGNETFYIIFTSGSTGAPKGVQITKDCLNRFVEWGLTLGNIPNPSDAHTFINQAPFSFDLSVMDLYLSLASAGTLWTLPKSVQNDYARLFASLQKSQATVWVSTPSFADLCLSDKKFSDVLIPNLHTFLFCGEVLSNHTASQLLERFPCSKIINMYGPTESTVAITAVEITREVAQNIVPLPVGQPKPGTMIQIADEKGNILPDINKGQIVIIGDTVSTGYFNRPDITNKSFFIQHGERAYYTGDEGFLKGGMLYYSGRIDMQIKLNGYRIEIEDIENNLLRLEDMQKVVVLPKLKDGKVKYLVAFVVQKDICVNGKNDFLLSQDIKKGFKLLSPLIWFPKRSSF